MLNVAKINLNTLTKNVLAIKSKLKNNVKFCAVVKADAYGHGAPVVANHIYGLVDCFAVALVQEGIELRNSGIDKDILVLTPALKSDFERAVYYGLTLTVEDKESVALLERECKRQDKKIKIHVKYNAGMNRFGVDTLEQLDKLVCFINEKKRVILQGMYAHLPCPQNKKSFKINQKNFLLANNLVKGYNKDAICHISASGGFLMDVQADMVRIGILLYGYKPFESDYIKVMPVMKVYAPIIKRRAIKKGESALYGQYSLEKDCEVALVRFGYADGLERKKVKGQINNRCMDITAVEDNSCKKQFAVMEDANKLAREYGTIPYEILTKVCARAQKIYIK